MAPLSFPFPPSDWCIFSCWMKKGKWCSPCGAGPWCNRVSAPPAWDAMNHVIARRPRFPMPPWPCADFRPVLRGPGAGALLPGHNLRVVLPRIFIRSVVLFRSARCDDRWRGNQRQRRTGVRYADANDVRRWSYKRSNKGTYQLRTGRRIEMRTVRQSPLPKGD